MGRKVSFQSPGTSQKAHINTHPHQRLLELLSTGGVQVGTVNARHSESRTNKLGYISCSGSARHEREGIWMESWRMSHAGNTIRTISLLIKIYLLQLLLFFFLYKHLFSYIMGIENKIRQKRGASLDSQWVAVKLTSGIFLPFQFACFISRKSWRWFKQIPACSSNAFVEEIALSEFHPNELPFLRYVNFCVLKLKKKSLQKWGWVHELKTAM